MSIDVLGPLNVDGEPGRLGPRDRVVLAALAVRPGQVVGGERLADALWGEAPPATSAKIVQGCVMRLRKVLGGQAIETQAHGYRLAVPADDIDSVRFDRLVRRGRELLDLDEPERAAYVLGEAIALWRGPALSDLENWEDGRIEAARLDELRRDVEELTVDAAIRAGRCREVLDKAHTLVAQAPLRERRWALLALAQYQAGRQAEALRTVREVRTLLATELGLDLGVDLVALEQAILRQDPALVAEAALPDPDPTCPYQGLLPYGITDFERFFGRDVAVTECLHRLASSGVLVVVGPSGSGKSSLVRAGVAAALEGDGHRVAVITPGVHPRDALGGLTSRGRGWVLVVDQCEEAITLCSDAEERSSFFRSLADLAERHVLVVALRADRTGEVADHPEFAQVVERGLFLLAPLTQDDLRACIHGPAQQSGMLLEPGLVDLLVREVEDEPGALPLLSHALRETWNHREGRTMTVDGYRATGGIRGAVARSAEAVYARGDPGQRALMRDLLMRLVAPSVQGEPLRSRLPRRLLADDEQHEALIQELVDARLITADDGVLQLAHEALARAWPRLKEWLEEDVEGQRVQRHLTAAADAWESMGRPTDEVYRGARLAQALDWRARADPDLTAVERAFLEHSQAEVDAELREARARAELEAQARRRTRRFALGLAVALVLTLVAAGLATTFQRNASDRATEADANRISALSTTVGTLDLSLLLAAEGARTADTPATRAGLLASLIRHRRATRVVQLGRRPVDAELSDGGKTLFVSTQTGVLAWDPDSTTPVRDVVDWDQPENIAASPTEDLVALWSWGRDPQVGVFAADGTPHLLLTGPYEIGGRPDTFGFSPDGRRLRMLVTADDGRQGTIREVDVATGKLLRAIPAQPSGSPDAEVTGGFSDDGSTAVTWTQEAHPQATMFDLADGSSTRVHVSSRPAASLGLVAIPTGVAQRWADGAVTLYNHRGRPTQELDLRSRCTDLTVSPDRTWAASADDQGDVTVWDIDRASGRWSQRESLVGHDGAVTGIAVDPLGQTLVTVSRDGTSIAWDLSTGAGFGSPTPGLGNRWISNRPQTIIPGRLVVAPTRPAATSTAEFAHRVAVEALFLDPRTGAVVDAVPVGRTIPGLTFGSSVAVSPDRTKVAVTYGYGTVVLDTHTRKVLARITLRDGYGDPEPVWSSVWSVDGTRLLLAAAGNKLVGDTSEHGSLVVVDTATWAPRSERVDIGGSAQTMEFSPDGRWLALGMVIPSVNDAPPGSVRILDARTLRPRRVLHLEEGEHPFDVSFSPDSRRVAVGTDQGTLSIFDVDSEARLHEPARVHNDMVQQVEWFPDANTVVTSGADGMLSLYDAERGLVRTRLPGSSEGGTGYTYLTSVAADKISAVTGERDGRTYPLELDRWLAYACVVAGRNLTRDEWSTYLPERPYRPTCQPI